MNKKPQKGDWVYIPDQDRAGMVVSVKREPGGDVVEVVAIKEMFENTATINAVPLLTILKIALEAVVLLSQIIPIVDGILPYLKRWWKELFGTKQERYAIRAYKRSVQAERAMKRYLGVK